VTELVLLSKAAVPPRMQRARGEACIHVHRRDGRVRVKRLYQDGCSKIRAPRDPDTHSVEGILINTAGGLTGGDRLEWTAMAGEDSQLTLTTQACERIYRSAGGQAEVAVRLRGEARSKLLWLPQETIVFDGGELERSFEADLGPDASLLAAEAVILGRAAMGEQVRRGSLRDHWRVRREGRLIFADEIRLGGSVAEIAATPAVLDGARAFATILFVSPDAERKLPEVRAALDSCAGASAFDGKLLVRLTARDGLALRRALVSVIEALSASPLPRVWRS
jgi:urease accessory protein